MMTSSNGNIVRVTGPLCGPMFSLICAWINDWVNNNEAGDLRRHRTHYDVTVMTHGTEWRHDMETFWSEIWNVSLCCCFEQTVEQAIDMSVIWDPTVLMWCHCNDISNAIWKGVVGVASKSIYLYIYIYIYIYRWLCSVLKINSVDVSCSKLVSSWVGRANVRILNIDARRESLYAKLCDKNTLGSSFRVLS